MNKKYWYRVTKYVKGGKLVWQICVNKLLTDRDREQIAESIGENTPGGHTEGWTIYIRKLRQKSKKIKVLNRTRTINLWE